MNLKSILQITNLTISIKNQLILSNLNLNVNENEIHIIMGPNGSGKSTLVKLLVGHPLYKINNGKILYFNKNLITMSPLKRAHKGIFLGFQSPYEIPGITNYDFLYLMYNQKLEFKKKNKVTSLEFLKIINLLLKKLKLSSEFLSKNVNQNLSGGEKKYNEILQMLLLNPKLIILDEIDSGLDIDAIQLIFNDILKNKKLKTSLLIITHNPKILYYLQPTFIHILKKGQLIKTGKLELINSILKEGYSKL